MLSRALLSRNQPIRAQRVLIVQDASGEPRTDGIKAGLDCLSLKPGDCILLFLVIYPFKTTNTSPVMGCIAAIGQKTKLHSSATIRATKKEMQQRIERKKNEYLRSPEIARLINELAMQQIKFDIEADADSLKEITVRMAATFRATCVILDRNLKRDQKYFLDNLSCGILRIKHDNNIETIRGLKTLKDAEKALRRGQCIHGSCEREAIEDIFESTTCTLCKNVLLRNKPTVEFSFHDLQHATGGFSQQNLSSSQGSSVYIGSVSEGHKVAIFEHPSVKISDEQFKSQVQILGNVRHNNVAMLLGWCSERQHRFLVYQYVCNGSLNKHLSGRSKELTWERRMKIAFGAAKGLQYLHSKNIYGHMRPKNILLNHDYHPLLVKFGLSRNYYEGLDHSSNSRVIKTFEYIAPEYEENGADRSKIDVYSFGVILLELITGPKTIQETNGQSYLRWARPLLRMIKYPDLIDPIIQDSHDLHQLFWMVRLAKRCISWDPQKRFSIDQVVMDLECIIYGCSKKVYSPTDSDELMDLSKRKRG